MPTIDVFIFITVTCIVGLLQAVMQGILFYKPFTFLNKKYKTNWFHNTDNKSKWSVVFNGKDYFVFKYFPFIMFTDLFHLAHGVFGLLLATAIAIVYNGTDNSKIIVFVCTALLYSTVFHFCLRKVLKIRKKFG